eukprot:GDKH01002986.1.p1 GENE.GDKH01002986.1~~GDKH01002986.1.p1  ORF type:complete len:206 (+),score=27.92 GDKH01002986.1:129-746(+)
MVMGLRTLVPVFLGLVATCAADNAVSELTHMGLSNDAFCQADSGGTCSWLACSKDRGPTDCTTDYKCFCKPGYCATNGVCYGCTSLYMDLRNLPMQAAKAGFYIAQPGRLHAGRAVWKQSVGANWVWYCAKFRTWILTDRLPNDDDCQAGIVSQQSDAMSPLQTAGWKFFDGAMWYDDLTGDRVRLHCDDRYMLNDLRGAEVKEA